MFSHIIYTESVQMRQVSRSLTLSSSLLAFVINGFQDGPCFGLSVDCNSAIELFQIYQEKIYLQYIFLDSSS